MPPREAEDVQRHEEDDRAEAFADETVRDHIDEGLRFQLDIGRKRQKQRLPSRLVDTVAERAIGDTSDGRSPEPLVENDEKSGRGEAYRQKGQRDADSEDLVDARCEINLNDEAEERDEERDRREKACNVVAVVALGLRDHIKLLLERGRAERAKADDERDELQVFRLAQHRHRLTAAHGGLDLERRIGVDLRSLLDLEHEKETDCEDSGAEQDEVHGAEGRRELHREPGAHHAPDRRARPNEAEDPLRLARIVDIVRECPELADQKDSEKETPEEKKTPPRAAFPPSTPLPSQEDAE